MKALSFDDCKKQVAKKHGYKNWTTMLSGRYALGASAEEANEQAAELYDRSKANEAVKEVLDRLWGKRMDSDEHEGRVVLASHLKDYSLPYPDKQ